MCMPSVSQAMHFRHREIAKSGISQLWRLISTLRRCGSLTRMYNRAPVSTVVVSFAQVLAWEKLPAQERAVLQAERQVKTQFRQILTRPVDFYLLFAMSSI